MGLRPTNGHESPPTCHSERSEESASSALHRKSRFLVGRCSDLLGMTRDGNAPTGNISLTRDFRRSAPGFGLHLALNPSLESSATQQLVDGTHACMRPQANG